jgi:hypothetical protein
VSEATTDDTLHHEEDGDDQHEDDSVDHAYRHEFPALAFSYTDRASVDDDGNIVSNAYAQDGTVVFGPYVLLPAGRYNVWPRVDILEFTKNASRVSFDVNDIDRDSVLVARRVVITDAGPIAGSLSFSLERQTKVEFRVSKQGPTRLKHRGATLGSPDPFVPQMTETTGFKKELSCQSFSVSALGARDADGNAVSYPQTPDGNLIYGPYIALPAGRYRVWHHIRVLETPQRSVSIETDVYVDHSVIAAKRLKVTESGLLYCSVDFVLSRDSVVEFRINKKGQVHFSHSGASLRSRRENEPFEPPVLPPEAETTPAERAELDFSETKEIAIAPAEFSIAQQTAHETIDGIVAPADSADGNVIYGPYLRVPAGRYRIHPHVNVEAPPEQGAQIGMDVYAADQDTVIAERWVAIADEGPVADAMDFSLDREALLEFRVSKKGNIGFKHAGATLRRLDADEPFDVSSLQPNDTDGRPIRRLGGSWFRRLGL